MEKDLRVLHQDDAGDPVRLGHIRFQERQHVDAPHAFAQVFHRSLCPPFFIAGRDRNGKHLVRVTAYGAADLFIAAVFQEVFTELFGKAAEIQLIDLIFQEPGSLHCGKLRRLFLVDEADAAEAVAACLDRIEDTGAGAELSELPVFLEHEEVILELS